MAGTPEFWARTLRSQSGQPDSVPIDLEELLSWASIKFDEIPLDGCLGLFMRVDTCCGILVKSGQSRGQRRFTIAHELGHFAIPHHTTANGMARCLEDDVLGMRNDVSTVEREANAFAAELLMPRSRFVADMKRGTATIGQVKELAAPERYDVSITACAIRLVELSLEPRALLCYESGVLRWQIRSRSFRYSLPPTGSVPPATSAVRESLVSGTAYDEAVDVTDGGWLAENWNAAAVLESTLPIPSLGQTLCLLDVVPER